jgi:alkanesulfonate monooxygenase SsuD/methylene tetrahydromethanopterin reductase-like flavin-dependent oxidoreductase (luciferase family)
MKTQRVRIGFAVVELALHHPVRLAVQTAVLDHLSQGRLIVGTGRGSAYNAYEYIGFGTTMEQGNEMLPEAEALLVKAWTEENVHHEGRFWNVAFPELRPRPYQQPHPPLVRACISESSVAAMAKLARPVLIGIQTVETLRHRLQLYRGTMLESGFSAAEVETALDQNWAQRGLYVSENDAEALETADLALKRYRAHLLAARQKYNPGGEPPAPPGRTPTAAEVVEHAFLAGSPQRVAEQIAELREAGVRNLLLNVNVGQISPDKVERSMRLFGDKVLPMAPS